MSFHLSFTSVSKQLDCTIIGSTLVWTVTNAMVLLTLHISMQAQPWTIVCDFSFTTSSYHCLFLLFEWYENEWCSIGKKKLQKNNKIKNKNNLKNVNEKYSPFTRLHRLLTLEVHLNLILFQVEVSSKVCLVVSPRGCTRPLLTMGSGDWLPFPSASKN